MGKKHDREMWEKWLNDPEHAMLPLGRYTQLKFTELALVNAEVLSGVLENVIRQVLKPKSNSFINKLFEFEGGIMGSFSAKINAAYAFGIIDEKLFVKLEAQRKIRNECAHSIAENVNFGKVLEWLKPFCILPRNESTDEERFAWLSLFLLGNLTAQDLACCGEGILLNEWYTEDNIRKVVEHFGEEEVREQAKKVLNLQ